MKRLFLQLACVLMLSMLLSPAWAVDPLPSWKDGPSRRAIVTFVEASTQAGAPGFIPVEDRIATFDNDGTLWSEQPVYFQVFFVIDRVKALAPEHPEWKDTEPYRSLMADDLFTAMASGEDGLMEVLAATHAGMSVEEFSTQVREWIASARHPSTNLPYTAMIYQPMRELLDYLRANGYKTYIVSGGGQAFMRPWTEEVYGIPPEQVIGSYSELEYTVRQGKPVLMKLPKVGLVDDNVGKPVGIQRFIGRRPVFAFGNSDGDLQMLQWTMAGKGPHFAGIVHHTDSEREWAYDRTSKIGKLDKALDVAAENGWTVVDMAKEWSQVHPEP
ncbi:haloacid dehalogenase-like hydrolase [Lysobacter sp. F60174L2]|uniref:haloacid dehalogenase-like hydrolase n=1 Tax=Lysobacter sp. F60174L2 TaxID=3459295 RepID=UPI00403DD596